MEQRDLNVLKLQWKVLILERMLANVVAMVAMQRPGVLPDHARQVIVGNLEQTLQSGFQTLLSLEVDESERVLLAEEFAQLVEGMKTLFGSAFDMPQT